MKADPLTTPSVALALTLACLAAHAEAPSDLSPEITTGDLKTHVEYLASEQLAGRLTGTEGERLATAYVAQMFEQAGLEPAGPDGTWFQEFDFTAGINLGPDNRIDVTRAPAELENMIAGAEPDKHWRPLAFSQTGPFDPAGIVFAGYGIEIPETDDFEGYNSYFHLDVEDKWVLVFRFMPENLERDQRRVFARYSSLRHKAMNARRRGARGMIVVSGPASKVERELVPLGFDASLAGAGLAALSITDSIASALVATADRDLATLQSDLDQGELQQGFPIPKLQLSARIHLEHETRTGRNVLARLPGSPEREDAPFVLVGAHVDHLGNRGGSSSRARGDELNKTHSGADDNASGVAAMVEIATQLSHWKDQGRFEPRRHIVFAAWSGEELGLLGASHYARELARGVLHDENAPLTSVLAANVNMDMIGRFEDKLILQGAGSSEQWPAFAEQANVPVGLPLILQEDPFLSTDAAAFYTRKVPIINLFTGAHEDYHTPADTPDKINYQGLEKVTRFALLMTRALAIDEGVPEYRPIPAPERRQNMRAMRVYLGTIPDYSQADVSGVRLSGVAPEGPAAKAGIQAGDTIVQLAGEEIGNIYDYTYIIAELKIGEEADVTLQRGDKRLTLKIIPASRQ